MQRVIVGGITGAGKSTFARRLAARCRLPYVELDALLHGPGWQPRPQFDDEVRAFTAGPSWVTDSIGYPSVRDLLWERADALVWLDYARPVVMSRVTRRTLGRGLLRRRLWNGNIEPLLGWLGDREHPVRWAWSQHGPRRALIRDRIADPRFAHLTVVRLTTPREARRFLAGLP